MSLLQNRLPDRDTSHLLPIEVFCSTVERASLENYSNKVFLSRESSIAKREAPAEQSEEQSYQFVSRLHKDE